MEKFDVIIVGGGASGLMCALNIIDKKVLILEQQDKIGKKILVTGNGRCNLTNVTISADFYNTNLVKKFLDKFNEKQTLQFFNNLGLETYNDNEGRVYPISNYAASVLDVLRFNINKKQNITIKTQEKALKISKNKENFEVLTNNCNYLSTSVVFCCGGNFNDMFDFCVDKKEFQPCLCSLITEKNKGLNGIKQRNVQVTLIQENKEYKEVGEILFKDNAISGIVIFNLSSYYEQKSPAKIIIDFLPNYGINKLIENINNRKNIYENAQNLLCGMFHKQIGIAILEKANIDININCNELTEKDVFNLANTIKNYEVNVFGCEKNNQIFKGGINLESLDSNLMSKQIENLYFAGESCNINGLCGGYNLQWAWTSGKIIADNLNKVD